MGYLIDLMISLFFPLNIEKKKKGNADNADVEDNGSPIYFPTMKDNKHSKVDKIIVFLIPNTTVNVLVENKINKQKKFFGRTRFMTPVIFVSDKCKNGEIINVKINSFNQNSLFGFHKINNNERAA